MAYVYLDTMRGIERRQPSFRGVSKEAKKELNSVIILVAWEICKHRNDCIFNNATPSTAAVLDALARETLQKQHEMEIGCPTDVRHVSHIGVGTNFDKPPRATLPTEICTDKSGQEAAACCHDIPRGPKNPRRKKAARASSASSFLSRSRSSSFVTACGDFSELRGGLRVA
uniref:CRIB domain-containing protein n=1 Tax=Oryza glumipatula TaxID=40148 RepID=A0A0E0ADD2_9ORYZ